MKTRSLIIIGIVVVAVFVFLFFSNDQQNTCEQMNGTWNVDHCIVTQEIFDSDKLTCDPGTVLENGTCYSNGLKLIFESIPESESDRRRLGWTPAFEYHRVQINGTNASKICSILKIDCPPNPVFDAINRHDKNYTYFYYELPDVEYLVKIDDGEICYTTDDVLTEETGLFENCVEIKDHSKPAFESESESESEISFDYEIESDGVTYGSQYQISGGTVDEIIHYAHSNSLIISLNESEKGYIVIVIQTGLLHSIDQLPFTYFVIVDGGEVVFEQLSPIVLKIPFENDTQKIEIIGTRW